ncbi:MAG: hypothetical protein WAZ15_06030 [Propioniciclava sp.]
MDDEQRAENAPDAGSTPPLTGNQDIDEALARLELGPDVHTHHDALAAVVDAVQRALNPADSGPRRVP